MNKIIINTFLITSIILKIETVNSNENMIIKIGSFIKNNQTIISFTLFSLTAINLYINYKQKNEIKTYLQEYGREIVGIKKKINDIIPWVNKINSSKKIEPFILLK